MLYQLKLIIYVEVRLIFAEKKETMMQSPWDPGGSTASPVSSGCTPTPRLVKCDNLRCEFITKEKYKGKKQSMHV